MSIKTVCLILASITTAAIGLADGEDAVTKAANNTSKIPTIAAEVKTPKAAFAGDVITAIASMPKSPTAKAEKMISATKSFLPLADKGKLADMVVAIVANTPFEALPALTAETRGEAQALVAEMDDKAYEALLATTMEKIGSLKDFSNDDKTILSAFALKLLARGDDNLARIESTHKAVKAIPPAYSKQVIEALPSVFDGDYDSVLGDTKIIALPKFEKPIAESKVPTNPESNIPHGTAASAIKAVDATVTPKPPVPPVYAEQF